MYSPLKCPLVFNNNLDVAEAEKWRLFVRIATLCDIRHNLPVTSNLVRNMRHAQNDSNVCESLWPGIPSSVAGPFHVPIFTSSPIWRYLPRKNNSGWPSRTNTSSTSAIKMVWSPASCVDFSLHSRYASEPRKIGHPCGVP